MTETEVVTEPSIADMERMLRKEPEIAETPAATSEKTAKTVPAPEPEVNAGERGADGKFKKVDDEPVPAGVQKRIDKAVKAQREAERRADEAEAQLEERTASRPAEVKPAPPVAVEAPGKPVSTDPKYKTYDEFIQDLTAWTIRTAKAADAKAETDRKGVEAEVARGQAWNARAEAAKLIHTDLDEVLDKASETGKIAISEAMHHTIFDAERGPEIAYFLAQHPDEAARIAKLKPFAAAAEIGKIEAALPALKTAETTPAKPAAAKPLPKPPAHAGGSHAPSAVDLNDDKLSVDDFRKEFQKRLKAA